MSAALGDACFCLFSEAMEEVEDEESCDLFKLEELRSSEEDEPEPEAVVLVCVTVDEAGVFVSEEADLVDR